MPNKIDLKGRFAVVTGGAQGFGRAITERFLASDAAGVAIWDRDVALAEKTAAELKGQGRVIAVATDVADLASVEKARDRTLQEFGRVDILVNNAGLGGATFKVSEYPLENWHDVMKVNVDGVFHCCRAVVPGMVERNYGRIVNIASIAGKEGNPNASAYSASKAAVIGFTKSLGKELATHDISVNAITPAAARTAILSQVTDEFVQYMLSKIPRGRLVSVEEVAALVAFCASEDCSFTTGGVFDISGGRATY
jgi:NAD(P)-dependent dehydrogenase (short-subunit alcohol dehydrogenase family)